MNAFNASGDHVNASNAIHCSQKDDDYEIIFTIDDILA